MPTAIIGFGQITINSDRKARKNCRVGVYKDYFDDVIDKYEQTVAKTLGGITPCIQGVARQGQTRHHNYLPLFDQAISELKKKG